MKNGRIILITLFFAFCSCMLGFAQEFPPIYPAPPSYPPQLVGLPGVNVERTDYGWTLKMPQGHVFIFDIDKLPALKLILLQPSGHLTLNQLYELNRLALVESEPIPGEFLIFPHAKGKPLRLYQCVMSFRNDRIFCNIVTLPTIPLPFRHRLYELDPPAPSF